MKRSVDGMMARAREHLLESAETKRRTLEHCMDDIVAAAEIMASGLRSGSKMLLCGNGGSAADCQHMAAELVGLMQRDFQRPALPVIALTTDTSFLTAFSNDYGFEEVFERQVRALGKSGDVLIGISTSGDSENVLRAVKAAHSLGMQTIGLTGRDGSLASMVTVAISIPSTSTQHIQEAHLAVEHVLCDLIECHLFEKAAQAVLPTTISSSEG